MDWQWILQWKSNGIALDWQWIRNGFSNGLQAQVAYRTPWVDTNGTLKLDESQKEKGELQQPEGAGPDDLMVAVFPDGTKWTIPVLKVGKQARQHVVFQTECDNGGKVVVRKIVVAATKTRKADELWSLETTSNSKPPKKTALAQISVWSMSKEDGERAKDLLIHQAKQFSKGKMNQEQIKQNKQEFLKGVKKTGGEEKGGSASGKRLAAAEAAEEAPLAKRPAMEVNPSAEEDCVERPKLMTPKKKPKTEKTYKLIPLLTYRLASTDSESD